MTDLADVIRDLVANPCDTPEDQAARAEVLARIRVTFPVDARLDRIADRLRASISGSVDVAAVNLIDDHSVQHFAGLVGDLPFRDAIWSDGLCAVPVENQEGLTVYDAGNHPTYKDNPFVTSAKYLSYSAEPLMIDDVPIGTVCVASHKPRPGWPDDHRPILADTAAEVAHLLVHG